MIKQNNYSQVKINRAISDLRSGLMVILEDLDLKKFYLFMAAELYDRKFLQEIFPDLNHNAISLIVTSNRANFLWQVNHFNSPVTINLAHNEHAILNDLLFTDKGLASPVPYKESSEHEAVTISLIKLAELLPATIMLELSEDNIRLIQQDQFTIVTAEDILSYHQHYNLSVKPVCHAELKLKAAPVSSITGFRSLGSSKEHFAINIGQLPEDYIPLIRVHSSCYTGDLLSSMLCDCHDQLNSAVELMASNVNNHGVIIYLMQEGRGIGFINKIRTMHLQEQGYDLVESNELLGFSNDERLYHIAAVLLKSMGYQKIRLLTNNPKKADELMNAGIEVIEIAPHKADITECNFKQLKTKSEKMGHIL